MAGLPSGTVTFLFTDLEGSTRLWDEHPDAMRVALKIERLPFVAENLGVITPEVESLRERFGFPGMAILQFAFGKDPQGPSFRPHNYERELAAYTGTHDNDTTNVWWNSTGARDSTPPA